MKRFPVKSMLSAYFIALITLSAPVLAAGDDQPSDTWLKASLMTTYTLNRQLNPFKIDAEVENGVVTLRGTVESDVERDHAGELARGVDGIREVKNELKVSPDASQMQAGDDSSGAERSFLRKVDDANQTAKVKSQLLWNSNTSGLAIDVDTRNAVVTLSGNVASEAEAELAEQIARNTRDVSGVENNLKVNNKDTSIADKATRESRELVQQVSDGWITAKVKSFFLYNRNVDGSDINVDTRNGVVTLRGHVDSDFEREQAITIARNIKGVKAVMSELTSS
ncbi:MAG: BON domain-containing protein [Gammaproteobacteria bacterium]